MKSQKVELEVIEFTQVAGRNIVATKVLSGEPTAETLLQSQTDGTKWRVKGSAFLPAEKWEKGIRGLILEGEAKSQSLSRGVKLISQ